jgi:hypothetical protein
MSLYRTRVEFAQRWLYPFAVFIGVLASATAYSQQDEQSVDLAVRVVIEPMVQEEFEKFEALAKSKFESKGAKFTDEFADLVRMLYYNKAYMYFLCHKKQLLFIQGNNIQLPDRESREILERCIQERSIHMGTFYNLSEYFPLLMPPALTRCEARSRLFQAEINFRPYSFLEGRNTKLLDMEKFNQCVVESIK